MKIEILAADQLVAAAANGVYQGIIVTLVVALSLRLFGRSNAATRHAVWFCTLLLVASLIIAHCWRGYLASALPTAKSYLAALDPPAASLPQALALAKSQTDPAESDTAVLNQQESAGQQSTLEEVATFDSSAFLSIESDVPESQIDPASHARSAVPPVLSGPVEIFQSSNVVAWSSKLRSVGDQLLNPISWNLPVAPKIARAGSILLLSVWLGVASLKAGLLLWRLFEIREMKRTSSPATFPLKTFFQSLLKHIAVNRKVKLRISPEVRSPILLGFVHPVVLLPIEDLTEAVGPVLRHELAHVSRFDDWANLIQQGVQALLFFHPGIWWISRRLLLEREIACDDRVLQQGGRPRDYALLLTNLAGRMQSSRRMSLLAPGVSTNKSQLKQRIDMILDINRNTSSRLERTRLGLITAFAGIMAVSAVYAAPRIVLAQSETPAPEAVVTSGSIVLTAPDGATITAPQLVAFTSVDVDSGQPAAPGDIGPGPKFKPEKPAPPDLRPGVPIAPMAPLPPMGIVAPPIPPVPMVAGVEPGPGPKPPRQPRAHSGEVSLEERLERLERMVQSLMAQPGPRPGHPEFHLKGLAEQDGKFERKEIEKNEEFARRQEEFARKQMEIAKGQALDPKEIEKIKDFAKREAMRGVEEAKRATREAERAVADQQRQTRDMVKEGSQKQLEALRKHQEALKREMERLNRQIEQLERNRKHLDEQLDQSFEENENENKNEEASAEEPALR